MSDKLTNSESYRMKKKFETKNYKKKLFSMSEKSCNAIMTFMTQTENFFDIF